MAENNLTPEKELLKFIESKKTPPTPERDLLNVIEGKKPAAAVAGQASLRKGLSFISLGGIRGRISYFRTAIKKISFKNLADNLKLINLLLTVVLAVAIILVITNVVVSLAGLKEEVEAAFNVEQTQSPFKREITSLKNVSHYLEKARQRDIFKMAAKTTMAAQNQAQSQPTVRAIAVKTENLRLVGISWSDDPDALIEDTQSKKTFFLKRGETINDLQVKAIFKDKIILSYQGDEIELK